MKRGTFISFIFIAAVSLFLLGCETDLHSIDLSSRGSVTVDDGTGPQAWNGKPLPKAARGEVIVYRVNMELSIDGALFPNGPCLVIGPSPFPFQIMLNGKLVSRYGEPGDPHRIRKFNSELVHLDPSELGQANVLELTMHVGSEQAPLPELAITDAHAGSSYVYWRNYFMTQLVAGGFLVGILLFVYFILMSIVGKGKDKRFLWFAGICGSIALAYVNMVFNHLAVSDTVLTKLSRIGFFVCAVMLSFYVMETAQLLHKKRWLKQIEIAAMTLASIWVIVQKDFVSTNAAFHLAMQFVITPNLVLSALVLVIAIVRQGVKRYAILLMGMVGVIFTSFFDLIHESASLIPYAWLLVYGYMWIVVCVFLELAIKQERLSRQAILQAKDLVVKNELLGQVFEHLQSGSAVLANSTEDLAVSTREISITGNQQAAAVREIVATMEDAQTLLDKIAQKSTSVREDSNATARKAEGGMASVREALKRLEAVIGRINESINLMTNLSDQFGSISDIVKLIESIATQIRIIAFNASLEAVAAGDAGKNFMIVADEVKRLSDSTMASVKNIRSKVSSIVSTSDSMVKVARQDYMALEQSWDIASGIGETLSGITTEANSSAMATAEIDASIAEESAAFRQIVQSLKEISSGVNNFVESSSHTSETTAKINDIAEQLRDLIAHNSAETVGSQAKDA